MEFALVLRELLKRWPLLLVGVLIAAVAATFSIYRLEDGKLKARSLQYSSASTQILVDTPSSALGNTSQAFEPLSARAEIYANFMASPAVLKLIGQQAGISSEQIYAAGPVNANEPRVVQEPTALKRNVQITGETNPYRLSFESQANLPTITINSQAPTTRGAVALANAAAVGLKQYVTSLESSNKIPAKSRVTIRQLGLANGGVVNGGIKKALAAIVFLAVFLLWCVLMLAGLRFRENWRASASLSERPNGGQEKTEHGGQDVHGAEVGRPDGAYAHPELPAFEAFQHDDERAAIPTRGAR